MRTRGGGLVRRLVVIGGVVVLVATILVQGRTASASTAVTGAGSDLAAPELSLWSSNEAAAGGPTVDFQESGSGAGRYDYADGLVDFAATDIPYTPEDGEAAQLAQTDHPFTYVPVSESGLGFEYHLSVDGVPFDALALTPADVCGIFTGEITFWRQLASGPYATAGDAALAALGQEPIVPIVRADSSGQSYVLSQYCIATEPDTWNLFRTYVDANASAISYADPDMADGLPVSSWPGTLYGGDRAVQLISGSSAAALAVQSPNGEGSITYVPPAFAKTDDAPVASVENSAGLFLQPTPANVQAALSYARLDADGTFDLAFSGSDPGAYFPSTFAYVLDPRTTDTPDPGVNAPLNQFLCYSVGAGQDEAGAELDAPLSSSATAAAVAAIEATPNAPPADQCGVGGPGSVSTGPSPNLPELPVPAAALGVAAAIAGLWVRRRGAARRARA